MSETERKGQTYTERPGPQSERKRATACIYCKKPKKRTIPRNYISHIHICSKYLYIYIWKYKYIYVYYILVISICVCTYCALVEPYVHICVCLYMCIYLHICIYIHSIYIRTHMYMHIYSPTVPHSSLCKQRDLYDAKKKQKQKKLKCKSKNKR